MPSDSDLPPLYADWMDAHLGAPIPRETEATCLDCAMCPKAGRAATELDVAFDPAYKCCGFVPLLPNFLAGRILADPDPAMAEGRASTNARIDARVAVTPLGIGVPQADREKYAEVVSAERFGRREGFRCPHYLDREGGLCGVWRHRPAVCATWFCRHVRGAVGAAFWKSIHRLLEGIEKALVCWCLMETGLEPASIASLFPPEKRGAPIQTGLADVVQAEDPREYAAVWGSWRGREREFYRECAKRVDGLAWEDVLRIGGAPVQTLALLARDAFRRLGSDAMPSRLRLAPFQSVMTPNGTLRIRGYSPYDLLDVPFAFVNLMPQIDGRTPAELADRIPPEALRRLLDFRVLLGGGADVSD
jgi:hypothetical protein